MIKQGTQITSISNEAKALEAFLRPYFESGNTDVIITYEQLSDKLGKDVRENRTPLNTARRRLQKEFNRTLKTEPGIGVKLCDSDDQYRRCESQMRHIGRTARRARIESQRVIIEKLDSRKRDRHMSLQAFFGVVDAASSSESMKVIENKVKIHQQVLPPAVYMRGLLE